MELARERVLIPPGEVGGAESLEHFHYGQLWLGLFQEVVVLEDVVSPDQPIVKRDEVVDGNIDCPIVVLVTKRFLSAVDFLVDLFIFEVKGLVLLVEVLLEELFGEVRGEAEGEHRVNDSGRSEEGSVLSRARPTQD